MKQLKYNELTYAIRGIIFNVYAELGPGLLESTYVSVLTYELTEAGFQCETQVPLPVIYKSVKLNLGYRIDILVNNMLIIEVKSVDALNDIHHKQLITYLKHSGKKLGLLVNFNCVDISKSIFRKINGKLD